MRLVLVTEEGEEMALLSSHSELQRSLLLQ